MSNSVMAWAFKAQASPTAKIVLLNLSDNADHFGRVNFSLSGLAKDCGLSLAETWTHLNNLKDQKLIMLEKSDMPLREMEQWQQVHLLIHHVQEG